MSEETGPEDTKSTSKEVRTDISQATIYCERCGEWVDFDPTEAWDCPVHGDGRRPV